jgi:hypothetical protein
MGFENFEGTYRNKAKAASSFVTPESIALILTAATQRN